VADQGIPSSGGGNQPGTGGKVQSPPGGVGISEKGGVVQEGYQLDTSDVGPQPKPRPDEFNYAVGVPYYLPFATTYRDSWEIFRDDPVSILQLVAMRRQDGQARALYRLLTMPLLAALASSDIIPVDGQEGGEEESQFIHDMFWLPAPAGGMTHSFTRFMRQVLMALFDGFAAFEMIYWVPATGPLKGKITLRKMDRRPVETLTFLTDQQGEFNGWRQRTFFHGRYIDVHIKKDRAFYWANGEEERPFYGVSMFESAFYHYDMKAKLYYITHLAAQRAAVGTRIGTMPPGVSASDKDNFLKALRDLGLAQYIALPSQDWTVTNLKEEGSFDFISLINHHNSQMSKSVLAAWFDDQQGSGGDTTLVDFGRQSDEVFMLMLQGVMEDIANAINTHIIPRFIDWNFASGKYPQFKWGELTEEQAAAIQDTFDKLAGAGQQANVTPEFMLELEKRLADRLGLDVDYDKIEREREEQKKALKEQQKAQMQAPPGAGQGQPGPIPGAGPPPVPPFGAGPPGGAPPGAPPPNVPAAMSGLVEDLVGLSSG
jgi:Protein of unknown function (DUF935)